MITSGGAVTMSLTEASADRLIGEFRPVVSGDADRLAGSDGVDTLTAARRMTVSTADTGGPRRYRLRLLHVRAGEQDTITDTDARGHSLRERERQDVAISGVGIADRSAANRWSVLIGGGVEVVATRNSPLTLTTPDGTQVVIDDERAGALGITLLPDIADQATTSTILGDRNADKRDTLTGTSANDLIDAGADATRCSRGSARTG
jgi:hypothetical protein